MSQNNAILYTGKTHTTGGREGQSRSNDNRLDIKLSLPGSEGTGTNPEQLFAAGWSACFLGAMQRNAQALGVRFPANAAVDAEVDLGNSAENGFFLQARLNVSLPGLDRAVAQSIVERSHQTCPYSKSIRGNVDVTTTLI
jgi:Ohr subfamily peroxiredoxin